MLIENSVPANRTWRFKSMRSMPFRLLTCFALSLMLVPGCLQEPPDSDEHHAADSAAAGHAVPSNRVAIPSIVRNNLGITFVDVEARSVSQTVRMPGHFEFSPHARREYHAMLGGRIELQVSPFDRVTVDQVLYTVDSPDWRKLQGELNETHSLLRQAKGRADTIGPLMAAHERHHDELEQGVEIWTERVAQLKASNESGVISAEEFARARAVLATTRAELAEVLELEAELQARRAEVAAQLQGAQDRFELLIRNASSVVGIPVETLLASTNDGADGRALWRTLGLIEVRAGAEGLVESLSMTQGAWAESGHLVLTTVQPSHVRFRAMGLQSDLMQFLDGPAAKIVPPASSSVDQSATIGARLTLGFDAHPAERTITLFADPDTWLDWMRPGVSAFLEVSTASTEGLALAIPRAAIVKDGLSHVFFRRDPKNPDSAIRVEADMGVDDGRWVVIQSGVRLGDEVVLHGAYELKLATSQSGLSQKGGHFHADGTFHDDH